MTLSPEHRARTLAQLFEMESQERQNGTLSAGDSWMEDHLQITMIQSCVTHHLSQVILLVEHLIIQDGALVEVARLFSGEARRDSKDKCDAATGMLLATSRAMQAVTDYLTRQANGRVKHADDMKLQRKVQKELRRVPAEPKMATTTEYVGPPKRLFGRRLVQVGSR